MGLFDFIMKVAIAFVSYVSPVTGFALSLVDSVISGSNIFKTLALGYLSNVVHDSAALLLDIGAAAIEELAPTWKESEYAAGLIVPNNQLTVPCSGSDCKRKGRTTNDYITRVENGVQKYYCPVCTKRSIYDSAQGKEKIILRPDTIKSFHSDLNRQNNHELNSAEIVEKRKKELRGIVDFMNRYIPENLSQSARDFKSSGKMLDDWFGLVFDAVRIVGELNPILGAEFSSKVATVQRNTYYNHANPETLHALVGNLRGFVYAYAVRVGAL